ncbi:arylsulfatase I-like [Littorina saxatilis]|uniref:Sulfatase N-terminal domain-containing protein n=1 Tax=Littorina saxatilis TaxID=31220 RepID=A0AAN9BL58_9CAEN
MPGASSAREPLIMTSQGEHSQLVIEEESNLEETEDVGCRRRCPKILIAFIAIYLVILVLFLGVAVKLRKTSAYPHVIVIIVDDLGWNDVEWNDPDMRTPTLKALLENGVLLNNSYAHPFDSPSRAATFTGMYPFHMGLQHERMDPYTPTFLPDNFAMLPAHLKKLSYKTYLVGKWHLGFCDWKYTPVKRGFDSFTGFYTDHLDYYTHRDAKGHYDFRTGEMVDFEAEGTHSTNVIVGRAGDIIRNHEVAVPLFLVISFQAVHSPVQVPQNYLNETCAHINDTSRRAMCAMAAMMDEGIANVTSKLRDKNMLGNSVIIVTSDNGGVTAQGSSNGPFRGENGELYEGGTRVMSLVASEYYLSSKGYTYNGLFHQVDWFPTIVSITGTPIPKDLDGLNHWHALSTDGPSPRSEVVYNIDETYNNAAIRIDDFKLIEGSPNFTHPGHPGHTQAPQLYDLSSDPGETNNLAEAMPEKLEYLRSRLESQRKSLVPAVDKGKAIASDPSLWNNIWSPGWC